MNFLVNDYDGGEGCTVYHDYYCSGSNAGIVRTPSQGGLYVGLSKPPFNNLSHGTGVAVSPDGNSLYFMTGIGSGQTLVQTDLSYDPSLNNPNLLGTWPSPCPDEVEGIAVLVAQ